jgi:hypothetical protein
MFSFIRRKPPEASGVRLLRDMARRVAQGPGTSSGLAAQAAFGQVLGAWPLHSGRAQNSPAAPAVSAEDWSELEAALADALGTEAAASMGAALESSRPFLRDWGFRVLAQGHLSRAQNGLDSDRSLWALQNAALSAARAPRDAAACVSRQTVLLAAANWSHPHDFSALPSGFLPFNDTERRCMLNVWAEGRSWEGALFAPAPSPAPGERSLLSAEELIFWREREQAAGALWRLERFGAVSPEHFLSALAGAFDSDRARPFLVAPALLARVGERAVRQADWPHWAGRALAGGYESGPSRFFWRELHDSMSALQAASEARVAEQSGLAFEKPRRGVSVVPGSWRRGA